MAEDIKTLIEKINQEGIAAAQEKAKEIELQAKQKAEEILEKAKKEANKLMNDAKEEIVKMHEKGKAALTQAGRDLLLVLRQEINSMLDRLIAKEVKDALSVEGLFKILNNIVKGSGEHAKEELIIYVNNEDAKALKENFIAKLKQEAKREIVLRPSESIQKGFIISFDSGKSQFDFSDKAMAEYIGSVLKPKLKEILQG
jgi:V/A-type H+-transporting ATPase subunit E